ncbi:sigma-70 family RNA polymerase sigma factor [Flammeovirga yaeyamensis]|uniref:Sigma-70 family RNA polymerase sigma factor n=2 Tax=Flammeovirga yaeyamensis TaxID=367791 RepID=A0AAX1NBC8_9BACT|nr:MULTISPECIES: sigma-70 family RNA polymerase sigma factor [Flammeovirga]ANQ52519.1 sigma-70 family RNA polymerase sigma factor [Flammeovirga sp. MY04]NMF33928.1 sigma-70 family RNA polymerase sigma factor [Flammeovirga yaeyamensis]QWG04812.1 sigma-70 family RNA polymerase sigma factor [Flammeovirga yaeyamensis]
MDKKEISQLLNQIEFSQAKEKLYPLVYDNLHEIAEKLFRRERSDHTLQPTLLVNEAYMNLVDQDQINWQGRTHFFAVGAQAIRRILVHHARTKNAQKRGGGVHNLELEEGIAFTPEKEGMVLDIHEGLEHLEKVHPRQAQVVELKFFGGLKMQEIADELGVSIKTIEVDWKVAKAWLKKFMKTEQ